MVIENRDTHAAFMQANLDVAAASGWAGWLQHNAPCAVLVVTAWGDLRVPWEAGTTPVMLTPVSDLLALADEPDLARVLQAYDPQREVAFVFLRADGGTSAYRVQPRLAPPQAFAEMGGQLSDFRLTRREFDALRRRAQSQRDTGV